MKSIKEGPNEPYITIPRTPSIDTTPAIVESRIPKPFEYYNETEKARADIDCQALTLLTMAIPNDLYNRVDSRESAKAIWDELEKQLQGTKRSVKAKLNQCINAYEGFKAKEGESLT